MRISNPMTQPSISLSPLKYADGSASYTSPTGEMILGSVNGPVEVTRRDTQKPEEATLEVIVKPGVGSSGVGERYVEGIIRGVLSRVILMRDRNLARKGIVVTLVVMGNKSCDGKVAERGGSYLQILPSLLNTSLLALLSAAIPMSMTYASTIIAVSPSGELIQNPSAHDIITAKSTHVLAFSSKGHLLLNESDGSFDMEIWDKVHDLAQLTCQSGTDGIKPGQDVDMEATFKPEPVAQIVRDAIEDRLREDHAWKLLDV
ncbi:hypothetical protein VTO42DRAFT_7155 [Malbranchea cinnamomea]